MEEIEVKPADKENSFWRRFPKWLLALLGIILLAAFIVSGIWLFRSIQEMTAATTSTAPEFTVSAENQDAPAAAGETQAEEVIVEPPLVIAPDEIEPWSGEERLNFLFMGVDLRCDEAGPTHTDSMMVVTVDPVAKSVAMLSLPRDLWVEIPGFGVDRINQAYYFGEAYEYPGGGQTLAMETVSAFLGVPVDYYLTVDFKGFIDAVDLIGGIQIDVPEPIDDPDYPDNCYGYEPFFIDAGDQLLDGPTALKYARTRATFGGDVDRAKRQQEVLLAVRDRVLRVDQFPSLILQAPQLWRTFQDNVKTNLSFDDALQLAMLIRDVPRENIRTAVLDFNYVYNEVTPDGRQVLVPVRNEIRVLRDELFSIPLAPTPVFEDLKQQMLEEDARVAVFNGTAIFGLAAETQSYLQDLGLNVVEIGNADSSAYAATQIIDYGAHPNTVQFLIQEMQIPPLNLSSSTFSTDDYDVLVIVGNDWAEQVTLEQ